MIPTFYSLNPVSWAMSRLLIAAPYFSAINSRAHDPAGPGHHDRPTGEDLYQAAREVLQRSVR
jgi:hypothetical protein